MAYLLGVDVGTSACRAVLFDESFQLKGRATVGLSLQVARPQWAEQDPEQVLQSMVRSIRICLRTTGIAPREILGLGLSGVLYSLLAVDSQGRPLLPLIQWSDNRAEGQANRLDEDFQREGLYQRTGCRNNAMYLPAKILWLREERGSLYHSTAKLISIKDYLVQYLTGGDYFTDYIVASASGLFNIHKKEWEEKALGFLDLKEDRLPVALPPQSKVGTICREAARRTGLMEGTPVYAGGGDGPLSNVGAGVIDPGQLNVSIGSGGILRMILDGPRLCPSQRTWCYLLKEDRWVLGGVNNGGMVLQWFWESFWGKHLFREKRGKERFALLDAWAASVPPGCEGLTFLPYLTGERTPHWRTKARAEFFGINSGHHRGHFARAVMEGLAFQMRSVFGAMEEIGGEIKEVRFTGGFSRSPFWTQMVCDILGREAVIPTLEESSALGAAVMAALGMGLIPDLGTFQQKVRIERTLHPDPETHRRYRNHYELFLDLYRRSVQVWERLREIAEEEGKP